MWIKRCINCTLVFDGDDCIAKALDFCLKMKGEERIVKLNIVNYNLQVHAHNGSRFDTWIILNNLTCDEHIVDIIEKGKGITSVRIFNGYILIIKKQIPQYLIFRSGLTHPNYSKKIR